MDVEPGQSHVTGASSTGPAGERVPADQAAHEVAQDASGGDGIAKDADSVSSGDPGKGRAGNGSAESGSAESGAAGKGSPESGSAESGSADKGSPDSGSADSGSADKGTDGKTAGEKGKRKRSFWRELFVIIGAALVLTILIKAFLVQVFQGFVIGRQGGGVRETFTVRKVSYGVGVERTFPVHSPSIDKIEVVTRGRVRRAKLYYLRDLRGKAARIKERRDNTGN